MRLGGQCPLTVRYQPWHLTNNSWAPRPEVLKFRSGVKGRIVNELMRRSAYRMHASIVRKADIDCEANIDNGEIDIFRLATKGRYCRWHQYL